jgi:hypothetical protein
MVLNGWGTLQGLAVHGSVISGTETEMDKFMKTFNWQSKLATVVVAGLVMSAVTVPAQSLATNPTPVTTVVPVSAPVPQPAPPLAYGVPQILQLAQAKISDDTIIAYIRNSGTSFGLNAAQIIYLRQAGVSDVVITAMLNQPGPAVLPPQPSYAAPQPAPQAPAPAPQPTYSAPAPQTVYVPSTPAPEPTVTYIQSVPTTTDVYPTYSDPYYYPPVSLSFGFGWGGWHGGGFGGRGGHR